MELTATNQSQLGTLGQWWRSLPFDFQSLKVSSDCRPIGFRFSGHITNISAQYRNTKFIVCGEAETQELAVTKAVSELLERTAMKKWLDENPHLKIKNSNGFAAHVTES